MSIRITSGRIFVACSYRLGAGRCRARHLDVRLEAQQLCEVVARLRNVVDDEDPDPVCHGVLLPLRWRRGRLLGLSLSPPPRRGAAHYQEICLARSAGMIRSWIGRQDAVELVTSCLNVIPGVVTAGASLSLSERSARPRVM
jgi:hypothetical protein